MDTHRHAQMLSRLAGGLTDDSRFTARFLRRGDQVLLRVESLESTLKDDVSIRRQSDGQDWFVWSWGHPMVPVTEVDQAVDRIMYVLTPLATTTPAAP
ncbi:hypothetical protein [Bailinhaonella thermotolerans]|uniref:Uncharacterized protein n=1 Tax=Bailinhaonella thermotolerans TaxID=1070861 RepID=A0A3A4AYJ1_9ACTN|nr:hypothetical protein [Bailinhaonella thermotolerans]RJL30913.1 hypothetical protein D5H75_21710 [Bailinhaonella thermotolerans]